MSNFKALLSGAPIAVVNADDLERAWSVCKGLPPTGSVNIQVVEQRCAPGVNAMAVISRVMLLRMMLQQGALDDWCDGDLPQEAVFRNAATFPLERGMQGFDPNAFIAHLRER